MWTQPIPCHVKSFSPQHSHSETCIIKPDKLLRFTWLYDLIKFEKAIKFCMCPHALFSQAQLHIQSRIIWNSLILKPYKLLWNICTCTLLKQIKQFYHCLTPLMVLRSWHLSNSSLSSKHNNNYVYVFGFP